MTKKEKEIVERMNTMLDKVLNNKYVAPNHRNGRPEHDFSNISDETILANKK